jgi:hypothetical protein
METKQVRLESARQMKQRTLCACHTLFHAPAALNAPVSLETVRRSMRFSRCFDTTKRSTKIPGTCTLSGSMDPTGTISSTSAIVSLAALAIGALKLRADLRKRRLPASSAFHALISATSPVMACEGRSCQSATRVLGDCQLVLMWCVGGDGGDGGCVRGS